MHQQVTKCLQISNAKIYYGIRNAHNATNTVLYQGYYYGIQSHLHNTFTYVHLNTIKGQGKSYIRRKMLYPFDIFDTHGAQYHDEILGHCIDIPPY